MVMCHLPRYSRGPPKCQTLLIVLEPHYLIH